MVDSLKTEGVIGSITGDFYELTGQTPCECNLTNGGGEYQYFRLEITDNQPWLKLAEFKFNY